MPLIDHSIRVYGSMCWIYTDTETTDTETQLQPSHFLKTASVLLELRYLTDSLTVMEIGEAAWALDVQ